MCVQGSNTTEDVRRAYETWSRHLPALGTFFNTSRGWTMSVVCVAGWVVWAGPHAPKTEPSVNRSAGTGKWPGTLRSWLTLLVMAGWLQVSLAQQNHGWMPFPATWGPMGGPVDQSALNNPLTHADALAVVGRHF